jgi:hypothetical protein
MMKLKFKWIYSLLIAMSVQFSFAQEKTVSSVSPTETQYIWPIPLKEILYNKLCTQNAGY